MTDHFELSLMYLYSVNSAVMLLMQLNSCLSVSFECIKHSSGMKITLRIGPEVHGHDLFKTIIMLYSKTSNSSGNLGHTTNLYS